MRVQIEHVIRYDYDQPVFLDPHLIRLRPGTDLSQRALGSSLRIDPEPSGTTDLEDAEGNLVTRAWFDGLHGSLEIRSTCEVETLRSNPYDYVLLEQVRLPLPPEDRFARALGWSGDPAVAAFAEPIARAADGDAQAFLRALVATTSSFERHVRLTGGPRPAAETLGARAGSCRDLSLLAIEACRSQGLPARFVSGYHEPDPSEAEQHMHAWIEVFLPGAGWRGFDPTFGLAVADRHVWLARATDHADAAPTHGSFRGTGVEVTMTPQVEVRVSP